MSRCREVIEQFTHAGLTIHIHQDEDARNPRKEFDEASHLILFDRYGRPDSNGDEHNFSPGESFDDLVKEIEEYEGQPIVWLPVSRYEHSQVAYSTSSGYPFNDPWDAGTVGLVYMTKKECLYEYGKENAKLLTKQIREKAEKLMAGEVEEFSDWANGDVFGYEVLDADGETLDSCWGYYGRYGGEGWKYLIIEAESAAEYQSKNEEVVAHAYVKKAIKAIGYLGIQTLIMAMNDFFVTDGSLSSERSEEVELLLTKIDERMKEVEQDDANESD